MDIDKELSRISKSLGNPLRSQSDYGADDILTKLAEHAGLDIEELRKNNQKDAAQSPIQIKQS